MSKVTRKISLWVLSFLFVVCVSVLGIHTNLSASAETTVVELTYKSMQFQNNTENAGSYWTSICFNYSVGDGVSTGNPDGAIAADFSDLLAKTTYTGSENTIIYLAACHWGWPMDFESSTFCFIYLRTTNAPVTGDTIQMKRGAWFVTGGNIDDKYVLAEDINLQFNGAAWETYVPAVDNTQFVTEFTNNGQFVVGNYNGDATSYPYEIIDGATASLPTGYTGAVAKIGSKINGGAAYINIDFTASQISAADVESVVARVYSPDYTADDQLRINNVGGYIASADLSNWCNVVIPVANITGNDGNLGSFAFGLRDKGTVSDYFYIDSITVNMGEVVEPEPIEPVEVTFTHVNSTFNNNTEVVAGMYYTVIHLDGVLTSGYFTQGDDFTDMAANVTGVTYFGFAPASIIAGPDKTEINWIILYSATAPTEGDVFTVTAGATFKVGGADTNVYKLANDISLKFNGTAWEVYDPNAQPPVDPEPEVPPVDPEPTEPVLVTFTHVNTTVNNWAYEGFNCTFLHFDGGIGSNGGLDGDYSDLLSKMTINDGAVDAENVSFICPNWMGAEGGIVLRFVTNPESDTKIMMPAGATFTIGGDDTNVYELANDISLKFSGTAWEIYDPNAQPPVDPEPEVPPVDPEPTEPISVTLTGANGAWNNFDYTDQGYFCTFLHFEGGIGGGGLDGDFSNLLSNVTLNGQPLDTENVSFVCARWIGWENGIILRFKTLPQENSILVFPAGTTFTVGGEDANVYEISETMELKMKNGKWNIPLPTAEFIGVNAWNNNIVTLAGSRLTILDFDVTAMGNAVSTDKNLIAMAGVSINGVKLTDIDGARITYMHGDNHMGIDIPASAIYPTQEYPITILKVAAGTVFENYELPEITLSLIGGTWVVGEFESMPEEDDYVTISDITGEERVELGSEGLMSAMDGFAGDVNFKFVYRSDEAIMNYAPYGGLAVYLNSTNSWDGWRIFFVGNVVYVYDATMGGVGDEHVLLGQAEFGIASSFEMQIEISVKQVGGKYSIVIGGSCAKILELNDITPIGDCIGGGISLYSATRSCSVKDYKYGDVFDPVLTINSKQEIVINEGEAVPEIDATAVDGLTEITPTYVWDEGAITDGKMNVGVWNCVVTATDANGNYATATVRVTVKGEAKYMVTFDGANEGEYAYGEKIVKPADPTKEATKKYQYTFDGWYNGDEKWDFDHDIVTSDVALVAKFIESDVYYKVAVTVSSETQTIYVTYGAQVDLSVFDKEGFEKEVKQNGEVITKLIVTEDTAIEITYTQSASNTPSGCAGGCAGSLTGVGGIGVLLTLISGGMLMRKKEETDEK